MASRKVTSSAQRFAIVSTISAGVIERSVVKKQSSRLLAEGSRTTTIRSNRVPAELYHNARTDLNHTLTDFPYMSTRVFAQRTFRDRASSAGFGRRSPFFLGRPSRPRVGAGGSA